MNHILRTTVFLLVFLTEWSKAQTSYTSSLWTWISGSTSLNQAGSFGTLGVENSDNAPGARGCHIMVHNPNNNTILLFGGMTMSAGFIVSSFLNDLWSFNISTNNWAWIGGSSTSSQLSNYGTIRVEAASNVPGGRYGHGGAFDPITNSLYIFGGDGFVASGSNGLTSDLWRFQLSTRQWTCMSGNTAINVASVYGTLGQESAINLPGGRSQPSMVLHQQTYCLYMYGGYGYASTGSAGWLGDFWRYNLTSRNWAALPLSQTGTGGSGTYNTIRVESATTTPGSRYAHVMSATNVDDTIWLFGGNPPSGLFNDLFRYNITSRRWTWMSGSSTSSSAGSYGILHQESSSNLPMARNSHVMEYHAPSNCLVLFGGNSASGSLMDTWRFNLTSLQWALVFGNNTGNLLPMYGSRFMPASSNYPGGREFSASSLSSLNGTFYIFGGIRNQNNLNDFWVYDNRAPAIAVVTTTTTTSTGTSSTTSTTTTTNVPGLNSASGSSSFSTTVGRTPISLTGMTSSSSLTEMQTKSNLDSKTTFASGSSLSTLVPTNTAPAGTIDASTIIYAGVGGGCLLLIGVAVAFLLVRRKSASKGGKQGMDPHAMPQTMMSNGVYSTYSLQSPNQFTGMMTTQQSVYPQNPMMNTMGGQVMYPQYMSQQNMPMGMENPVNTNANMGFPMNTNMNTGMNGNIGVIQQSMMQNPVVNSGQGAGTIIVDDNETPMNYNQFQY